MDAADRAAARAAAGDSVVDPAAEGQPVTRHPEGGLVGIVFVIAALACFTGVDTSTKAVGVVPVAMVMWFRFGFQAAVTAAVLMPRRGRSLFATHHFRLHALRGTLMLTTSAFSYLSLRYLAVGEFTAIIMLTPLIMTLIAATVLSEPVSPARWVLIVTAFIGGLLVIKPGSETFDWSMLLPLAALASNTGFHLVTSRLARIDHPGTMHFYTGFVAALLASVALPFAWVMITSSTLWLTIGLVCVFSASGHALLILSYSKVGVATLTPMLYLQIVFGTLVSWLVFAHVPDRWSFYGIVAITVSGAGSAWLSARQWARAGPARVRGR